MKLYRADQVRGFDRQTIEEMGISGLVLMENAGVAATELFCAHFRAVFPGAVVVLAGKGNNGGDGYVMARHLHNRGWQVTTLVLAEEKAVGGDAAVNLRALTACGGTVTFCPHEASLDQALVRINARVIIDALFGTGLTSPVRDHYARAIDWINRSGLPVFSVDIPSGIDATSGRVLGAAVKAKETVTFAVGKIGQVLAPGCEYAGRLHVVDIGIPPKVIDREEGAVFVEAADVAALFPARPFAGHKGTFGHLVVVGGSTGKSGAAAMAAEGALRSGAGLVTVGCPASIHDILEIKLTEAMTVPLPDAAGSLDLRAYDDIKRLWLHKQALALGPGLGLSEGGAALAGCIVRDCPLPLVIDADGINALCDQKDLLTVRPAGTTILTPHPGEMARLTGMSVNEIEADRVRVAGDFAKKYGAVLVLKGARTVIASPEGDLFVNSTGNPGLATGGMGDVLTGVIAGLIVQGLSPLNAAVLGTFWHGRAADDLGQILGNAGLTATDLLRQLPLTRHQLLT